MLKYFFKCLGVRFLPISICPVIFGAASASYHGGFSWLRTILCMLFVGFSQMTGNLAHQYYIAKHGLRRTKYDPDVALLDSVVSPKEFLGAALAAFMIFDLILGLALMSQSEYWVFLVGGVIVVLVYFYQAGPYPLGRHGWTEFLYFLLFGPVAVIGTTYINVQNGFSEHIFQTNQFAEVLALSVISGLCVLAVLFARDFYLISEDRHSGRTTLAVRMGRNKISLAFLFVGFMVFVVYYYIVGYMQHDINGGVPVPVASMWIVPMVYLVVQIVIFILMHTLSENKHKLILYLSMCNMAYLALAGVVLSVMYGDPDQLLIHYF